MAFSVYKDAVHQLGIDVIQRIQEVCWGQDQLMILLSHFGDPRYAFTIYFPVAFYLHQSVGIRVLWVASIAEWLNAILKWMLCGERPYWWVHESGLYNDTSIPHLNQYKITCETGPGSPSGHAMITSAVWYILVSDFIFYKQVKSSSVKCILWVLYGVMMLGVCVSRLFIATHFPHQVAAGVVTGILLARLFNLVSPSTMVLKTYLLTSVWLSVLAILTYFLVYAFGRDPSWSVSMAVKWCAVRDWVHLDTTPFYSLTRDVSSLTGLGFALWLSKKDVPKVTLHNSLVQLSMALVISMASDSYKPAQDYMLLFYVLSFLKHMLVTCLIVAGVSRVSI